MLAAACALSSAAADYTTYGGDQYKYHVTAIVTDAHGNTYVTGSRAVVRPKRLQPEFPERRFREQDRSVGPPGAAGRISGSGSDQANGIAVDLSGNIYLVGTLPENFTR
jgi:hypothetical protein